MNTNIRRCSICSLTYYDSDEFKVCARCEQPTNRLVSETENPSLAQSRALVIAERAAHAAEANEVAQLVAREAAADARAADAGAAAIAYDVDHEWTAFAGSLDAWVRGAAA